MVEINLMEHAGCEARVNYWRDYLLSDEPSAHMLSTNAPHVEMNSTARNMRNRAKRKGFIARAITWAERNEYLKDLYEINTSVKQRQGRQMSESYLEYPKAISGRAVECDHHYSRFFGVFTAEEKLVGYISADCCGRLAAASQILGHHEYLDFGIMLLLWEEFVQTCWLNHHDHIVYSRWKDGQQGLKYWKHSVGLQEEILKEKK